jgi:DNA-binding NarL/FixJ family response regulator
VSFSRKLQSALDAERSVEFVGRAADGREAVELATAHEPDVVIVDVELPDAVAAVQCLLELLPKPPRLILMCTESPDSETFAATAGAAGFVRKTGDASQMVGLVVALAALTHSGW